MISQIVAVVSGLCTLIAAGALILAYKQFRQLDKYPRTGIAAAPAASQRG